MFFCSCNRVQLMSLMPRNGNVAEIGTAKGEFAEAILKNTTPETLHLIDPWEYQPDGEYAPDLNNVPADRQEDRYQGVLDRFSGEIASGQIKVHRSYSNEAADGFEDGYFDFVYIDGLHTCDGVYSDLKDYAPKVKPGGFIAGHDYTDNQLAIQQNIGTIEAVNRFVAETEFKMVALTLESFPTYVLATPGPHTNNFVTNLLFNNVVVMEIQGYPEAGSFTHREFQIGERRGLFPSIRLDGDTSRRPNA